LVNCKVACRGLRGVAQGEPNQEDEHDPPESDFIQGPVLKAGGF
jgi:hypothetical protein